MARTRGCFLNEEKITCCWDKWPRFVIAAFFLAFTSTGCLWGKYVVVLSEGVGRTKRCFQCLYVHGLVLARYFVFFASDGLGFTLLCVVKVHWESLWCPIMFSVSSFLEKKIKKKKYIKTYTSQNHSDFITGSFNTCIRLCSFAPFHCADGNDALGIRGGINVTLKPIRVFLSYSSAPATSLQQQRFAKLSSKDPGHSLRR